MRTIQTRKASFIIATVMAFVMAVLLVCMIAEASTPRNGRTQDAQGNIYIYKHGRLQTGWFKYHGKWYYGHKSKSVMYPKGAVARNTNNAIDMAIEALEKQEVDKCCETCKHKKRSVEESPCCDCYMSTAFDDSYEPYTEEKV